jgi:hypothetical protein
VSFLTVVAVRVLARPPYGNPDLWTYVALGSDLAEGARLDYSVSLLAAKPLAIVLGMAASPLPVDHGLLGAVEVALALVLAALFFIGYRLAGPVAGAVAVIAFAVTPGFRQALISGYIDAVTAALVVLAIGMRGSWRIVMLILAGLLRPEAWPVAAFAAFHEAGGSWRRRSVYAALAGAAAPLVWLTFNRLIVAGNLAEPTAGFRETAWAAPYMVAKAVGVQAGIVVGGLGVIGLGLRYWGDRRERSLDLLPLAVVTIWPSVLALAYFRGLPESDRYVLPIVAVLSLEVGRLAARLLPTYSSGRATVMATALACLAVVASASTAEPSWADVSYGADHVRIKQSISALEPVLSCGRLALEGPDLVADDRFPRGLPSFIPELAAVSGQRIGNFGLLESAPSHSSVLAIDGRSTADPSWRRRRLPLGELAVSPACESRLRGRVSG